MYKLMGIMQVENMKKKFLEKVQFSKGYVILCAILVVVDKSIFGGLLICPRHITIVVICAQAKVLV